MIRLVMIAMLISSVAHAKQPRDRSVIRLQKMLNQRASMNGLLLPGFGIDGIMGPATVNTINSNLHDGADKRHQGGR